MTAQPGDWVIHGVKGEIYPCRDDIFAATYDEGGGMTDTTRISKADCTGGDLLKEKGEGGSPHAPTPCTHTARARIRFSFLKSWSGAGAPYPMHPHCLSYPYMYCVLCMWWAWCSTVGGCAVLVWCGDMVFT
jgi:hypothetical protein